MATETREGPRIAVFGSSEPTPGDPAYAEALEVGRRLGEVGAVVVTGGYGGVMEAASRGARETGGRTLGVTCSVFGARTPNRYLDQCREEPTLLGRTRTLLDLSEGFIILAGRAGTLAELAFLWAMQRAGDDSRPRVVLGRAWEALLAELSRLDILDPPLRASTLVAADPRQAVDLLLRELERTEKKKR